MDLKKKDPERFFSDEQKKVMFDVQKGICPSCGELLNPYDKLVDGHHLLEHSQGGPTEVENGQLLHKECHAKLHFVSLGQVFEF